MKERTLASWVALNEITRVRISGELPDVGEFDGDVEFASAEYRWQARVSETGVDQLRRIDIDVSYLDDPDNVIGRATGFLTLPAPSAARSGWAGAGFVDGEAGGAAAGRRQQRRAAFRRRRAMTRSSRTNGGFTLLEILVAMAVFAIFSYMAYGGFNAVARQQAIIADSAEATPPGAIHHAAAGA